MDSNTGQASMFSNFKSLAIEISIILVLSTIVVGVLNYLNIIDIKALFSSQSKPSQFSKDSDVPQLQPKPVCVQARGQGNPYLQNLGLIAQNNGLHYAQIISEFEGKIKTLDFAGGTDPDSKQKYQIRLEMSIGTSSATTVQFYPQEAMDKIKVTDATKKELSLKDIKTEDTVTIKTNIGVLRQYPNNFNEVVITKH